MILQFDDIFSFMMAELVLIIVVGVVLSIILFLTQLLIGAVTFKWGLEAVDGKDEGFGSRVGTIFVVLIINTFLPYIGLFLGWKYISNRHELNYGESILAYLVHALPLAIITAFITILITGIAAGIYMIFIFM